MLYPLGALSPASKMRCRSSAGIGVPSKLGVARRSRIAWLNVLSCFAVFADIARFRPDRFFDPTLANRSNTTANDSQDITPAPLSA
jgi:hypothetical protein